MKSGCGSGPGTGDTGREQGSGTKQVTASRQALAKSGSTGRDQRATLAKQDYEKSPLHGLQMSCFWKEREETWTTIMRVDHQEEREAPEDHNHQKMNQQRAQGGECRGWRGWSRAQGQGWDSGWHGRAPAQQETGILSCSAVRCHLKHMDQYPCSSCKLERDTEQPDEGNRDPGSDKDGSSRSPSHSSWEPGQAHSCAPQTLQGRKNCLT